jgi:hypothetical protein
MNRSIESIQSPDLTIDESMNDKYLALQISFFEEIEIDEIMEMKCIILVNTISGIVYCVYPLTVDNATPIFYNSINPQSQPTTTNIFNNLAELENFGELHYNPYSEFYKSIEDGLFPNQVFTVFDTVWYEEELNELLTHIGEQIDIDYNHNESFCRYSDIGLNIIRMEDNYTTNFTFSNIEEDEIPSPIEAVSPEAIDGSKKRRSKSKKRRSKSKKRRSKSKKRK